MEFDGRKTPPNSGLVHGLDNESSTLYDATDTAAVSMDNIKLDSVTSSSSSQRSPQSSETSGEQNPNIFVGDITKLATEIDLRDMFRPYGGVVKVEIIRAKGSGNNLRYGFVTMDSYDEAKACIDNLNGCMLCGFPVRLAWGERNRKLSVTNLAVDVNVDRLNEVFGTEPNFKKKNTKITTKGL